MSHLHIPDGVLPPIVWIVGAVLAALGLAWAAWSTRHEGAQAIAYRSALGGIMLAVMAIPVPVTAFDYCMTLAGPVGVLLGGAGAFQVGFAVTLILALMGQGGFTAIGLNTLVLGLGAAAARPLYLRAVRAMSPGAAMALATATSQLLSSALWIALLALSVRLVPQLAGEHEVRHALPWLRGGAVAVIVVPLLAVAVCIEAMLGYGVAGFLSRVRPDLLPGAAPTPRAQNEAPTA